MADVARGQVLRGHARVAAHHAAHEGLGGHFQAEDRHRLRRLVARAQGDVFGDVERQGGLAHRGPRRQDDQVAGLHAQQFPVDVHEARGNPRDALLLGDEPLDLDGLLLDQLLPGAFDADLALAQAEERRFRFAEEGFGFGFALVAIFGHHPGGVDDAPQEVVFVDALEVVLGVGGGRRAGDQAGEFVLAAHGFEAVRLAQPFGHGDEIDGFAGLVQGQHRFVQRLMALHVERLGRDLPLDAQVEDAGGVLQGAAQHGPFGLLAVRRDAIAGTRRPGARTRLSRSGHVPASAIPRPLRPSSRRRPSPSACRAPRGGGAGPLRVRPAT